MKSFFIEKMGFPVLSSIFLFGAMEGVYAREPRRVGVPLSPSDITILFPLPKAAKDFDQSLKITERLPKGAFRQGNLNIAPGFREYYSDQEIISSTVLVGLRLDPCFQNLPTDRCHPQIRGVWQPVVADRKGGSYIALDATAHSFHSVTRSELKKVLKELSSFRVQTTKLSVHPKLEAEGYNGAYLRALKAATAPYLQASRVHKVAFMSLEADGIQWRFDQVEKTGQGQWQVAPVKGAEGSTDGIAQKFINWGQEGEFLSEISASSLSESDLWFPLVNSIYFRGFGKPEDKKKVFEQSRAILTTTNRKPGTMDCMSCHGSFALERMMAPEQGIRSISHLQRLSTLSLRSFGYFGKEPRISPRVFTETEESLMLIRSRRW